ncbi:ABC transporter ATP-binding protein [Poseidonocella sedimentorum]|uniref:ABC-2 type transport system ATP-binding protein n=1 Tax=Poseidonocella sedimentorum TaxID=871652 RepID=A0A1I6D3N9_9RHOB|nr:ABC transporter ATP-binding protein [Poseidonocella sedimentorum]SFR00020.1 ABC-2 type transport system ATP-binding protein [Poseidonocella sedimentorum]
MTALDVRDVRFSYGEKEALKSVSFSLEPGRFCALLGPNGAGKSTLFALMTRLLVTGEGRITIAGHDIARAPRAALAAIGVVFQQPTLDLDMTVTRNMRYFAALHGISGRDAQARIDAALDRLSMRERADEKVRALNGGHRRRMEIARALIHQPRLLLLDEPTVGLDTASRRAITDHVHELATGGLTVFWATHLVDEITPEDEVVVLHRGEVLAQDSARSIAGGQSLTDAFMAMTGAEA